MTGSNKRERERERGREKAIAKLSVLHANGKISFRINNIHHIHIISEYLGNLCLGLLERTKCQIIQFFSGTSYRGDRHEVTFTTSNISLH